MKDVSKFLGFLLLVNWQVSWSQVGIGTFDPNPSSILELNTNTQGLLIPRMNSTSGISSPEEGLLVYNTSTSLFNFYDNGWKDYLDYIKSYTISDMGDIGTDSVSDITIPGMSISPVTGKYLLSLDSEYCNNYMITVGANTATLLADFNTAYTQIEALTYTIPSRSAFGSGETIIPGNYSSTAAITISGTLTLDAKGDPNALFVFNATGAINMNDNTIIILLNGALAENVFWVANTEITVGLSATVKGIMMADTGITIGNSSNLIGKALTKAGDITFGSGTYTNPSKESSIVNLGTLSKFVTFTESGTINLGTSTSTYNGNIASGSVNTTNPNGAIVNGTIFNFGNTPSVSSSFDLNDTIATFSIFQNGVLIPNSVRKLVCNPDRSNLSLQTIVEVVTGQSIDVKWKISSGTIALGTRTLTLTSVK